MTNPDGTAEPLPTLVQPRIVGYRQLSAKEAALMNEVKELANEVGRLVEGMALNPMCDTRWVTIARTTLQTGFMQLTRSVAKPESF